MSEKNFSVSFLLPLGPLDFEDIGRFNLDMGCAVCGNKITKRCSGCQSVTYCSAGMYMTANYFPLVLLITFAKLECQSLDWPMHKLTCKSIKGGTWLTIPFTTEIPGISKGSFVSHVNKFDSLDSSKIPIQSMDDSAPLPDIHGDKPFLVKFQLPLAVSGMPGNMMIYDRKRSMKAFVLRQKNTVLFDQLFEEMCGPRADYEGIKVI
jgi:hypothetical protein